MLGLLLYTGSLNEFVSGTLLTFVRYGVFALSIFLILVCHAKQLLSLIAEDAFLFITLAIACLSFTWSDYPNSSIQACFELFRVSVFAVFLSLAFSSKQQLKLLLINFGIGAVLCMFFAVAVPSIGIDRAVHVGAWQGIYQNKNTMGAILGVGALIFFIDVLFRDHFLSINSIGSGIVLLLSSFLILMSTSKSALVSFIAISLAIVMYRQYKWRDKLSILLLSLGTLLVGISGLFVLSNWNALLLGLDRDPTLTGRTIIWQRALEQFMDRPWLGFGQGAFWSLGSDQQIYVARHFSSTLEFLPPHAHNGFVEILLDIGIVGLIFFLINFITNIGLSLRRAYRYATAADWLPLTILASLSLRNLTESQLMRTVDIGIFWILYILVSLSLKHPKYNDKLTKNIHNGL
ncbi:MAG: O-antigen ligase [Cyanobacteria bacterium J06597_1]